MGRSALISISSGVLTAAAAVALPALSIIISSILAIPNSGSEQERSGNLPSSIFLAISKAG